MFIFFFQFPTKWHFQICWQNGIMLHFLLSSSSTSSTWWSAHVHSSLFCFQHSTIPFNKKSKSVLYFCSNKIKNIRKIWTFDCLIFVLFFNRTTATSSSKMKKNTAKECSFIKVTAEAVLPKRESRTGFPGRKHSMPRQKGTDVHCAIKSCGRLVQAKNIAKFYFTKSRYLTDNFEPYFVSLFWNTPLDQLCSRHRMHPSRTSNSKEQPKRVEKKSQKFSCTHDMMMMLTFNSKGTFRSPLAN